MGRRATFEMVLSERALELIEREKINVAQVACDAVAEILRCRIESDRTLTMDEVAMLRAQIRKLKDQLQRAGLFQH
jgi:S-adenosylmethionine synthetase